VAADFAGAVGPDRLLSWNQIARPIKSTVEGELKNGASS
jgi:hypothetical protein